VLFERGRGRRVDGPQVRRELCQLGPDGRLVEVAAETIIRVRLEQPRAPPARGRLPRDRGGYRAAADPTLANDKDQATIEYFQRHSACIAYLLGVGVAAAGGVAGGEGAFCGAADPGSSSTTTAMPLAWADRQPISLRKVQMPSPGVMSTLMSTTLSAPSCLAAWISIRLTT